MTRSHVVPLLVERERARAGAWYEMVPRSQGRVPGQHGTFDDCIARVPEIADARLRRSLFHADPSDRPHQPQRQEQFAQRPSPAILAASTPSATSTAATTPSHPELGTLDDFRRLVERLPRARHGDRARFRGAVLARSSLARSSIRNGSSTRPDGSIKFAENPPKKYEDIVNPDFNCADRIALWEALRDVILFWVEQGVRIFRVDNPHTKPLPFWEWLIREVRRRAIPT